MLDEKILEENRRLRKRVSELATVFDIGKTLSLLHSRKEVYSLIINVVTTILRVELASLLLLDEKKRSLKIVASKGLDEEIIKNTEIKLGERISGMVAKEGKPLLIENIEREPAFSKRSSEKYYTNSLISVPLKAEGKVVAVLNVNNKSSRTRFVKGDLRLVSVLANQAAIAIRNIQLQDEIVERTRVLMEKDRMSSLGFLAAGIAHEINNPNGLIRTNLQTFQDFWKIIEKVLDVNTGSGKTAEKVKFIRKEMPSLIEGMLKGTSRIYKIVANVSGYTKRMSGKFQQMDVVKCIESGLSLIQIRIKGKIEIHKEFEEETSLVYGNPQSLEQVFVNLFTNAIDAMEKEERKVLTIRVGKKSSKEISITVQDSGEGIKEESLGKIFEPLFTTKRPGGTGLGLFVTHAIVEEHRGKIEVESSHGEGTTFRINLPVANE